jgi:hypothetical protein
MSRAFDLIAVIAVAVVLLLPKGSLQAQRALATGDGPAQVDRMTLTRLSALEDAAYAQPGDAQRAVELADGYLAVGHPDWALATLAAFGPGAPHTVHLVRATAHAERLEPRAAVDEVSGGLAACDVEKCPEAERIRLRLIAGPMQALVDAGVDPYADPKRAKEVVARTLHATKASSKPPAPQKAAKPIGGEAAPQRR